MLEDEMLVGIMRAGALVMTLYQAGRAHCSRESQPNNSRDLRKQTWAAIASNSISLAVLSSGRCDPLADRAVGWFDTRPLRPARPGYANNMDDSADNHYAEEC
jgi:hypothetical protein